MSNPDKFHDYGPHNS